MAYSSENLAFIYYGIISYISKGRNITWQDQTNMSKVFKHQGKDKQASIFIFIFIFINQNNIIFKSMHVHVNAWLTLLTSLHHNTYVSMHGHIHMHTHSKQINQNPNWNKGDETSKTKQNREVKVYRCEKQLRQRHTTLIK